MTKISNPAFDYTQLSKDEKSKLTYYEGQLIRSRKRVVGELMKHGEILHGAQDVLANHHDGVFREWLAHHGISHGSAYNAISAFVEFGSCPNLDNLEVSALYLLAKNPEAKKKALKLADKGVKVTHGKAKELVESTQPKISPPPARPQAAAGGDSVDEAGDDSGEDARMDSESGTTPEEPAPRPPRNGKEKPGEKAVEKWKCPNCAGTKWKEDEDGFCCAKCLHPYGEPAGDVDSDRIQTQRQKTVKTVESLMRAFDDLQMMLARPEYDDTIAACKSLLKTARAWK